MQIEWGLWIDDPWSLVSTPEYWDEARSLGVRTADVMLDTSRIAWDPMWKHEQLASIAKLTRERDIELVVLGWPAPRQSIIDAMLEDFADIAELGVSGLGIDTEHLWSNSYNDGSFVGLHEAAGYLLEGLRKIRDENDVRIELTTHPGHREATARATLSPFVDRFYLQSYSTRHDWRGDEVRYESRLGPGRRQRADVEKVFAAVTNAGNDPVKLCLGQALWDQRWPGKLISNALDDALDAGISCGVRSFRGWSSKWVIGVHSHTVAQKQVKEWMKKRFSSPT